MERFEGLMAGHWRISQTATSSLERCRSRR
jgi:hypothetical protein